MLQALQPGAVTALDAATLESIAGDVPSASLEAGQIVGQPLVQVMVASGLQPSKAASKRMIKVGCSVIYHLIQNTGRSGATRCADMWLTRSYNC